MKKTHSRFKRWLIVLILLGIGIWFASPYWVLYQLHEAIEQKNFTKVLNYVDLEKVSINPLIFYKHQTQTPLKDHARYTSFNTFEVTTHQYPIKFILTRHGLNWKITQIQSIE